MAYFTSCVVTTVPFSNLTSGWIWKVQVRPLSLTVPMSVARSGTTCEPQLPAHDL